MFPKKKVGKPTRYHSSTEHGVDPGLGIPTQCHTYGCGCIITDPGEGHTNRSHSFRCGWTLQHRSHSHCVKEKNNKHPYMATTDEIKRAFLAVESKLDEPLHGSSSQFWAAITNGKDVELPACWTTGKENTPHGHTTYTMAAVAVFVLGLYYVIHMFFLVGTVPFTERTMRDLLIALISIMALYIFWVDVKKCRVYDGLLRLILILFLTNVLLPCIWRTPPRRAKKIDADDEEDDEPTPASS